MAGCDTLSLANLSRNRCRGTFAVEIGLLKLDVYPLNRCWRFVPIGVVAGAFWGCSGRGQIIELGDEHNYSYLAEMTLESWDLPPLTDARLNWLNLTDDLQGRPIEAGTIDQLTLIAFGLSRAN